MRALPKAELKLLVVDDDANTRQLLSEVLEGCGAQVRVSATASEARRTLAAWHPDLVISDLAMPREDGYELIRRVRDLSPAEGGRTPAIACTGCTDAEDRERAMHAGFDAFVAKPIDIDLLVETIVQVTGVRGSRGVGPGVPSAAPGVGAPASRAEGRERSAPDS